MEYDDQTIYDNPKPHQWTCPKCGTTNFGSYCHECGRKWAPHTTPEEQRSPCSCGYRNVAEAQYCSRCGRKLGSAKLDRKKSILPLLAGAVLLLALAAVFLPGRETEHTHSWNAATCTAPETCSSCGATNGTVLEHSWKEATFVSPQVCTRCSATIGTKIPKPTILPASVAVANGETAVVRISSSGKGLTYRWYYKNKNDAKFTLTDSFKGNSYSVTMSDVRNGRQVYCEVTDKYGNSVNTDTATLQMKQAQPVTITAQPQSVTVEKGKTATVTVKATGEGLTYRWYFKNAGDKDYTYTDSFKGSTYSVTMNAERNGRRVLCKIYDKHGNSVQSSSALLSMKGAGSSAGSAKAYTESLNGITQKVTLRDGNSSMNVHALVFIKKIQKCTKLTVHMSVDMKAGTSCKEWQLWGRTGGSFQKIGKINLPGGNGDTVQTVTFSTPVTFDALAITPTIPGGYSWSMGFAISDVWVK